MDHLNGPMTISATMKTIIWPAIGMVERAVTIWPMAKLLGCINGTIFAKVRNEQNTLTTAQCSYTQSHAYRYMHVLTGWGLCSGTANRGYCETVIKNIKK